MKNRNYTNRSQPINPHGATESLQYCINGHVQAKTARLRAFFLSFGVSFSLAHIVTINVIFKFFIFI
ncbi:MAG: hypothetical protein LBJ67_05360, partial [Planctomycetaceae bacterium]|nr:hypothetical protein [Planctomycetaceae bacterium]